MFRLLSVTAFAGAVLAFALPFGAVSSCGGEEARFTGVQLATFDVPPGESGEGGGLDADVERRAGLLAFAALVAAAAGAALSLIGRRGTGWCAVVGLTAMQLAAYGIITTSDSADLFVGYWLALGLLTLAGVVVLTRELRTRVADRRSVWPPLALALAIVLPPLGLIVTFLLWVQSLVPRVLRRLHTERYV